MCDGDAKICALEEEIAELRRLLRDKEECLRALKIEKTLRNKFSGDLDRDEVVRYSRQLLIPEVGVDGQVALKRGKVLIIGIGGLGCPASLYLASAGVGELTLVDNDVVEISNLHRQVLHDESTVGIPKVLSACEKLKKINPNIKLIPKQLHANSETVKLLLEENQFDVVIDGSDNVATRYLLNDACVLNGVPLVSGSALQFEGQLTVYNYKGGPCYRCLFPTPPPPETVTSCGDGGVLGPVPGMIGVLQALETIKILTKSEGVVAGRLMTFDGADLTFRNIKLRPRSATCAVCGDNPTVKELIDYEQFCGSRADDKVHNISILGADEQIKPDKLDERLLIVDVRPELEYRMCHLPNSVNIPYSKIQSGKALDAIAESVNRNGQEVYVLCRRGNDSQRAIAALKPHLPGVKLINIKGGLHSYSKLVDDHFPVY